MTTRKCPSFVSVCLFFFSVTLLRGLVVLEQLIISETSEHTRKTGCETCMPCHHHFSSFRCPSEFQNDLEEGNLPLTAPYATCSPQGHKRDRFSVSEVIEESKQQQMFGF